MNKVCLTGRLVAKPEIKDVGGKTVCSARVAVKGHKKDGSDTEFLNLEAWEKTADNIAQFFDKGREIGITGRIKTDKWEKDGTKHERVKIVVESFDFIGSKGDQAPGESRQEQAPRRERQHEMNAPTGGDGFEDGVDGIPF